MANVTLKPGTNVPKLKKALKQRGFVLREYHQPDGSKKYTLHRNPYLQGPLEGNFEDLNELLGL